MPGRNVYLNGMIVPADQASVSVGDAGLLHGASTFTTMRAHRGRVFRLSAHLQRLMESAEVLGIRTEARSDALEQGVDDLLRANEIGEGRLRITLTPGDVAGDRPTTLITADPLPDYPSRWYDRGLQVVVSSFQQHVGDPTFGMKTGCYFPRILALREATAKGADEALWYTTRSQLAEACFCNVFLVIDGRVMTPPRDTPVLPGVVRQAVFELCEAEGIPCDAETPLTVHEMLAAEEMFLTGSCSGIRPVARIERHEVGDGAVGPVTTRLMRAYRVLLDAECASPGEEDGS